MRTIFFDVEGTLVDSVPQNLQSWQDTLKDFGFTVPMDILQLYSGMDGDEMLQLVLPAMTKAQRTKAEAAEDRYYNASLLKTVKPFAGVRKLFESLRGDGWTIGLATDCAQEELTHYIGLLCIADLINVIACGNEVEKGKPGSSLIELAIEKAGATGATTIMVGDTPYDAEAATSVGVLALGVLTGGFARDALIESGCFHVAQNLDEVARILHKHRLS